MIPNQRKIIEEGVWEPTINTLENKLPTITYNDKRGSFKKIGNLVYISFYIKGKITALNGTNNYAVITGLPFKNKQLSSGENTINLGTIYELTTETDKIKLFVLNNMIRIQYANGSGATKLKVTTTNYFEIGGSGWYEIE